MGKGTKSGSSGKSRYVVLNMERMAGCIANRLQSYRTTCLIIALKARAKSAFRLYRKTDRNKITLKVTAEDAGQFFGV